MCCFWVNHRDLGVHAGSQPGQALFQIFCLSFNAFDLLPLLSFASCALFAFLSL
jgi:hypothetical protein